MGAQAEQRSLSCCCKYSKIAPRAHVGVFFVCCVKNVKHNRLANVNNVRLQIKNEILQLVRIWVIACTLLGQHVCGGVLSLKTRARAASLSSLERLARSL